MIFKVEHYLELYDRYFSKFRNKPVRVLEIGVLAGGSLDMWKEYFGKDSYVAGMDINPSVRKVISDGIDLFICDQEDRDTLIEVFSQNEPFDIIIDDGGHTMNQQKRSFEALYPLLREEGVYLVEDVQTSYWKGFDGGLRREGTFIEFAKSLIDYVNKDHFREEDTLDLFQPLKSAIHSSLTEVHFHDGMCFFIKSKKPVNRTFYYNGNGDVVEGPPTSSMG